MEKIEIGNGIMVSSTVEFNVGQRKIRFNVVHNLPDVDGLSLTDAVTNWAARTKVFTAASLSDYINKKGFGYTCHPEP